MPHQSDKQQRKRRITPPDPAKAGWRVDIRQFGTATHNVSQEGYLR